MPQPFNSAVMTNGGAALLTKAQAGECNIEFTRMAIGNGVYTAAEETVAALQERTALKSEKNSYQVNSIEVYTEKSVKITAIISNQDPTTGESLITDGYYINEIGLYAKEADGASSTEVLYSIATTSGEEGDYMPPYNGYNPAQITQDYYATVDNSAEVTIDTSGALETVEDANKTKAELTEKIESLTILINQLTEIGGGVYDGVNVEEAFGSEIAEYADAWEWIKDRIDMGAFTGLKHGDYIPLEIDDYIFNMQMNIDVYYNSTDQQIGHMIDFISKEVHPDTVAWNTTSTNNGNANESNPYLCSSLYTYLNGTLYNKLPDNVKKYISDKRALVEERYSSSGTLTDSTARKWADIGNLWIPSVWEVFASYGWGTPVYSEGQNLQYPIFAGSQRNVIKNCPNDDDSTRRYWWLLCARSGNSTYACAVNSYGYASGNAVTDGYRVPVCFRIQK